MKDARDHVWRESLRAPTFDYIMGEEVVLTEREQKIAALAWLRGWESGNAWTMLTEAEDPEGRFVQSIRYATKNPFNPDWKIWDQPKVYYT